MKLAIGIPSYQGALKLPILLSSINDAATQLLALTEKLPVFVVLDGSTDASIDTLEKLSLKLTRLDLHWHLQSNSGRSSARNKLISLCTNELLWFLDDDTIISSLALSVHLNADRSDCPVIMGPCRSDDKDLDNWFYARYENLIANNLISKNNYFFSVANASAPLSVWRTHLFDESFIGHGFEDYDLGLRIIESGVCINYSDNASIKHYSISGEVDSERRWIESGVNLVRFCKKHEEFWDWSFRDSNMRRSRSNKLFSAIVRIKLHILLRTISYTLWTGFKLCQNNRVKQLAQNSALIYGVAIAGGAPKLNIYLSQT